MLPLENHPELNELIEVDENEELYKP